MNLELKMHTPFNTLTLKVTANMPFSKRLTISV
jgi:hypothetical protein